MNTVEYLKSAQNIKLKIINKQTELQSYRDMCLPSSPGYDQIRVKSTSSGDKLETLAIHIVTLENELGELIKEYDSKLQEIKTNLQRLENHLYESVLFQYYVLGLPIYQVAKNLNYASSYIYEIKARAIEKYDNFK